MLIIEKFESNNLHNSLVISGIKFYIITQKLIIRKKQREALQKNIRSS